MRAIRSVWSQAAKWAAVTRESMAGFGRVAERSDSTCPQASRICSARMVRPFQLIQLEEDTDLNFTSRGTTEGTREGRGGRVAGADPGRCDASFTSSMSMMRETGKHSK